MVLKISSDVDKTYFEVLSDDPRFAQYPYVCFGRMAIPVVSMNKDDWFDKLADISSWVTDYLKEECHFEMDC